MVTDLHAKNTVNIYKRLGKKVLKTFRSLKFTKSKARFQQKSIKRNETQTRSVSHGDLLTCKQSGQYLQAFRKKVWKTNTAD